MWVRIGGTTYATLHILDPGLDASKIAYLLPSHWSLTARTRKKARPRSVGAGRRVQSKGNVVTHAALQEILALLC